MVPDILVRQLASFVQTGSADLPIHRPVDNDITLSVMRRAKASGFTALVVTLDTIIIGWRPHDLAASYLPFVHGVGSQVGLSDPVFMKKHGEEPILDVPAFPYDPHRMDRLYEQGDEKVRRTMKMAAKWIQQTNSGKFNTWEDLKFIRDNWDGPLILKGILDVEVSDMAVRGHTTLAQMSEGCRNGY